METAYSRRGATEPGRQGPRWLAHLCPLGEKWEQYECNVYCTPAYPHGA